MRKSMCAVSQIWFHSLRGLFETPSFPYTCPAIVIFRLSVCLCEAQRHTDVCFFGAYSSPLSDSPIMRRKHNFKNTHDNSSHIYFLSSIFFFLEHFCEHFCGHVNMWILLQRNIFLSKVVGRVKDVTGNKRRASSIGRLCDIVVWWWKKIILKKYWNLRVVR